MKIKVAYCGYVRKDGTINSVLFDTETKEYWNDGFVCGLQYVFVEAAQSRDVAALREYLDKEGYTRHDQKQ